MNTKTILASTTLIAALALAATAATAAPVMQASGMQKCYGVAGAGKNDCAAGAHSCAGQATCKVDDLAGHLV
jgi:uncharacterized membrane protein